MAQIISKRELRDIIFREVQSWEDKKKLYQYLINIEGGGEIEGWEIVKKIHDSLNEKDFLSNTPLKNYDGDYTNYESSIANIENDIANNKTPFAVYGIQGSETQYAYTWTQVVGKDELGNDIKEILYERDGRVYRMKRDVGTVEEACSPVEELPDISTTPSNAKFDVYHLTKNMTNEEGSSGDIYVTYYEGYYTPTKDGWKEIYVYKNAYDTINRLINDDYGRPFYAYEVSYTDYKYQDAQEYCNKHYEEFPTSGCTAVRKDNIVGCNMDWYLSELAEFIIHTPRTSFRHEVIGFGGNLPGLTDEVVESKEYDKRFEYLPCFLESGMNDAGLVVKMNVISADKDTGSFNIPTKRTNDYRKRLCALLLTRYLLDNCATVDEVINLVKVPDGKLDVYMPYSEKFQQEFHFMVADGKRTICLEFEDGEVTIIDYNDITTRPILTNFRLKNVEFNDDTTVPETYMKPKWNTIEDYGMGIERFQLVVDAYSEISSANAMTMLGQLRYSGLYIDDPTRTDKHLPYFKTEFTGKNKVGGTTYNLKVNDPLDNFEAYFAIAKQAHEVADREAMNTWITTHSVVYDIKAKTVKVCFQEIYSKPFEYKFQTVDLDELEEVIAAHLNQLNTRTSHLEEEDKTIAYALIDLFKRSNIDKVSRVIAHAFIDLNNRLKLIARKERITATALCDLNNKIKNHNRINETIAEALCQLEDKTRFVKIETEDDANYLGHIVDKDANTIQVVSLYGGVTIHGTMETIGTIHEVILQNKTNENVSINYASGIIGENGVIPANSVGILTYFFDGVNIYCRISDNTQPIIKDRPYKISKLADNPSSIVLNSNAENTYEICNITSRTSITLSGGNANPGYEHIIKFRNTGTAECAITPAAGMIAPSSIKVPSGKFVEISYIYDGTYVDIKNSQEGSIIS